ncbi:glycosyltransferase family 4 protein [Candidatus Woesearchaeota archaeon]|nr:glycosyltransferase family 4 protein [Candidatus Woesearchaeota archaeon]
MKQKAKKGLIVVRTIESFYPYMSGPANQAFRLSRGLEKRGIRSPVLTTFYKADKSPAHEMMDGVEVFRFPIRLSFMKYFWTPDIKKAYSDFDIACGHSYRSYQTEVAYRMARKAGKPFILHNHGSLLGYRSFVHGWRRLPYIVYDLFHRSIALDADAVIVNTKQEFDEAVRFGVSRKKIHTLPVAIDTSEYTPAPRTWKELRLLFVGRISKDRNIEPVIRAVALLKKKGLNVKLRVVGGAVKRSDTEKGDYIYTITELVKSLGVEKEVSFEGPRYGADLREYYKTSDIFVYTSLWENFGQTILEAAAAGLPLICTRVGVAPDLIEKGKTGWIVNNDAAKEIAKGITTFTGHRTRTDAGIKLMKKVKTDFNLNKVIEIYLKTLDSLNKGCRK